MFMTLRFEALLWLLVGITAVWVVSMKARDASLVDLCWGPLFAAQGVFHLLLADSPGLRGTLAVATTVLWAARLSLHLAMRNLGAGEDRRYAEMRRAGGSGWGWRSLVTVFWFQALLSWLIAWPLAIAATRPGSPGWLGWLGAVLAVTGLALEAVADAQVRRFKAREAARPDASAPRGVMDLGLWRYSRHPNYFGDAVFWWGLWMLALDAGAALVSVAAPLGMTFLLIKISGIPLLEGHLESTRPGYAAYARRTSAFVPWFPRDH
jgi:steroid 5-alpha reductase family enzyme